MSQIPNYKHNFDLEERTYEFAKRCRDYAKKLPRTISNIMIKDKEKILIEF